MAIVEMQKVAILAHNSHKEELLEFLHTEGVLEVREAKVTDAVESEVQFKAADVQYAIETLTAVASKESIAASQKPATEKEVKDAVLHTDVLGIVEQLRQLEESDTQAEREIQEAYLLEEQLVPWVSLPYALGSTQDSANTVHMLGIVPTGNMEALEEVLAKKHIRYNLQQLEEVKQDTSVSVHVWKSDVRKFEEVATVHGWSTVELPALEGQPAKLVEQARLTQKELEQRKLNNVSKREELSIELPNLVKVHQYLGWLTEKSAVRSAIHATASTATLFGWMAKKKVDQLESRLQKKMPAATILKVKADESEEAPVLLQNKAWVTPFESVTTLYGLPTPYESDPTAALSPFFILFFALCLTDAGYGAVLAALFGGYIWKTKITPQQSPLLWLLFMCGILTFFVSIPFGGWFGLAPSQVPEFLTYQTADGTQRFLGQVLSLGERDGIMFFMYLSLILGITHIFFGLFLAGQHKWVHGKKAEAFWQSFSTHILLGSVLFVAFAPEALSTVAQYVLYIALALMVWGQGYGSPWYLRPIMGGLGFVNFCIGLLSNGLSYLRILALGLVTGSLAGAVNQVAAALGGLMPWYIGIPVIIVIFLVGHLVSIALNALGTFIHSGRLQFIEFFSQFFEGGGQPFAPFRRSTS